VLLVFGPLASFLSLSGPEHGRTIPLADKRQLEARQCSTLLPPLTCYPSDGHGSTQTRFRTFQVWPKDFSASLRQVERAVDRQRRGGRKEA
jgi:hypothetical protein